ncbi:UDP-N-acetylmuramoyl-L-alanyl-D-glutamate--2,6-diaminopimelate ligase [bacterium]|nr:UDP-N-acetylmuramoyl-L-alanyl-D-glutamate--2,6-diaminopimelate ligase [bacterium]
MIPKKLKTIIEKIKSKIDCKIIGDVEDLTANGITSDSRKVDDGKIFVAIKGVNSDGHNFIEQAIENGAVCIVADKYCLNRNFPIPLILVDDTYETLVFLLEFFLSEPPKKLYAVTGTNGKTTTTYILWNIFKSAGEKAGVIGTLGYMFDDGITKNMSITTPDVESLWKLLARMRDRGITAVAIEASSHGIDQKRILGLNFRSSIFTNLSRDHLDYHSDMESYLLAKCKLFESSELDSISVVNIDDPASKTIIELNRGKLLTYAIENKNADVISEPISMNFSGSQFKLKSRWGEFVVHLNLPGRFNIYNATAAAASALATGYSVENVIAGIESVENVKGRFQIVDLGQPFQVIIDYAHTPDALKNLIITARKLSEGRVIVVFGAGGDRDNEKRPIMGNIATELADYAIITSDNPRSENPDAIIDMIVDGTVRNNFERITDRKNAIFRAISIARAGDTVLIAGKGHEDYQIFAERTIHFDDVEIAEETIKEL